MINFPYRKFPSLLLCAKFFSVVFWTKTTSCVQLFANPWTVAHKVPLSVGFSRQEQWSELPFPPPNLVIRVY